VYGKLETGEPREGQTVAAISMDKQSGLLQLMTYRELATCLLGPTGGHVCVYKKKIILQYVAFGTGQAQN